MPSTPAAPAPAGLPREGDVIGGKYRIVRLLGQGGMGAVYEATHVRLRHSVAVKILLPEMTEHAEVVERFEREARAAAQLHSPHVARVIDVDTTPDGVPYMVMEFLQGHDLSTELQSRTRLPVAEAVKWMLEACDALDEAHRLGVIHRDLKPANLFLSTHTGRPVLKVLDFGISKLRSEADSSVTSTQSVMGTPLYMSPEQGRSTKNVDARTDIWSLGVILYELLAGRPPFEGSGISAIAIAIVTETPPPLRTFRDDVPPALEQAMMRALEKNPTARFATVRDFADALDPYGPSRAGPISARASSRAPISAAPPPSVKPSPTAVSVVLSTSSAQVGSSRRARTALIAGAAVVLAVGTIVLTRAESSKREAAEPPAATVLAARGPEPQPQPSPSAAEHPTTPFAVASDRPEAPTAPAEPTKMDPAESARISHAPRPAAPAPRSRVPLPASAQPAPSKVVNPARL